MSDNKIELIFKCASCGRDIDVYVEDEMIKSDEYLECAAENLGVIASVGTNGLNLHINHGDLEIIPKP